MDTIFSRVIWLTRFLCKREMFQFRKTFYYYILILWAITDKNVVIIAHPAQGRGMTNSK